MYKSSLGNSEFFVLFYLCTLYEPFIYLFPRSSRVVANWICVNLRWGQYLPPHVKSLLITILGRRNLLSNPVLRSLIHEDIASISFGMSPVNDSTVNFLKGLTKLRSLLMPNKSISSNSYFIIIYFQSLITLNCVFLNI